LSQNPETFFETTVPARNIIFKTTYKHKTGLLLSIDKRESFMHFIKHVACNLVAFGFRVKSKGFFDGKKDKRETQSSSLNEMTRMS
jgi:hypothetical protein